MKFRWKIDITGRVQGVGFRPFCVTLANDFNLTGFIGNNQNSVFLEVQGKKNELEQFTDKVKAQSLPGCAINSFICKEVTTEPNEEIFKIEASVVERKESSHFLTVPDRAICSSCLDEIKQGRRKDYLFNSCAFCGPRYSIMSQSPFDRVHTSMKFFTLCNNCQKEYSHIQDRRFHAQTMSCPDCGPYLELLQNTQNINGDISIILHFVDLLKAGEIIALKSTGGFQLVCDASNEQSVNNLRKLKHRPEKPFAVMYASIHEIEKSFNVTSFEKTCIQSTARPIVLIDAHQTTGLAKAINRGLKKTGLFLPDSALYQQLLNLFAKPVVVTSFNRSGEPMYFDEKQIDKSNYPDITIAKHNRKIENSCDDSVYAFIQKTKVPLRVSKGVAPYTMQLMGKLANKVLAVGGSQKVTLALGQSNSVVISPPLGDILTLGYEEYFENYVQKFLKLYNFKPEVIVCDPHSGYFTNQWAKEKQKEWGVELKMVFHHHAHALSLMVENHIPLQENLFCAVWDGTGLGYDGLIRGGEFLNAKYSSFQTEYSFLPFALAGNESASKEPWKVTSSILFQMYGKSSFQKFPEYFQPFTSKAELLYTAWENRLNMPLTTSVGRLFDAAASLLGVCHLNTYEAEAAMRLEDMYDFSYSSYIDIGFIKNQLDWRPLFEVLLEKRKRNEITQGVSIFMNSMAWLVVKLAQPFGKIGLTGGVFQNRVLLGKIIQFASDKKIRLYLHKNIPCNDGGLSLGQIAYGLKEEI